MKNLLIFIFLALFVQGVSAKKYYINPTTGSDKNSERKPNKAYKSINAIDFTRIQGGDSILFAAGQKIEGGIVFKKIKGNRDRAVVIGSYGRSNSGKAIIDGKGHLAGIIIEDCSYLKVEQLQIEANGKGEYNTVNSKEGMRCGVILQVVDSIESCGVELNDLLIQHIFYENPGFIRNVADTRSENGKQGYGYGIRVFNTKEGKGLCNWQITNCTIRNVSHTGIRIAGKNRNVKDFTISSNRIIDVGGPGIQMSNSQQGHIRDNYVCLSGSSQDSRNWKRGSGLWTWGCNDILIEKNQFLHARGPADSAGAHIDYNCNNVVMQYNLSVDNEGGFIEILGNNYNCCYRYNVSVDDGSRIKGQNGAFQEGKIFWLSGYIGNEKRKGPFNSYIYNNTIFVSSGIVSKVAIENSTENFLVANNIFCIEGKSKTVLGDQYKSEEKDGTTAKAFIFRNNLFYSPESWPADQFVKDVAPLHGNPQFKNKKGKKIEDYIPDNSLLIKDKSIAVTHLSGDSIGLSIGLDVRCDILGNPIVGIPDMGAIEIQ